MPSDPPRAFGPFYPPILQPRMSHAERMAEVLDAARAKATTLISVTAIDDRVAVDVWLIGRIEELETFVFDVVDDFHRGVVTEEEAAAAIDRHLTALHTGVRLHLTNGQTPACCGVDDHATSVPTSAAPSVRR